MRINRDPFAREELHRETVEASGCDWCGQRRRSGRLFRYIVESDGGRSSPIRGEFCSVMCMRSYHA